MARENSNLAEQIEDDADDIVVTPAVTGYRWKHSKQPHAVFHDSFVPPMPKGLSYEEYYPLIPQEKGKAAKAITVTLEELMKLPPPDPRVLDDEWRERMEAEAAKAYSDTRAEMVIRADLTYWATAAFYLRFRACWSIPTAGTDGRFMYTNPDFWLRLEPKHRLTVLAHELSHNLFLHHSRRGTRDPQRHNVAADVVINTLLRDAGFEFPDELPIPPGFNGPAIKIAGMGEVMDGPQDGQYEGSEGQWRVIGDQAMGAARMRGHVPGGLEALIGQLNSKVSWKDVLREFLTPAKQDYAWSMPNRRFIWSRTFLPGRVTGQEMGTIVVLWDTSGSMYSEEIQAQINGEINAISQLHPRRIVTLTHDVDVQQHEVWVPDDGDYCLPGIKGGGGTSHLPVMAKLAEIVQDEPVECVLAFTDLYSEFPAKGPDQPILWIHQGPRPEGGPPYGQFVEIPL